MSPDLITFLSPQSLTQVVYNLFYEPTDGRSGCYTADNSKVSPCSTGFGMRITVKPQ